MENNILLYNKNELLNWFTTDNKSGYKSTEKWLKKHQLELYNLIILNSNNDSILFIEKILLYLKDIKEIPCCPICGNKCNFNGSIKHGFASYCSNTCSNKSPLTTMKKITATKTEKYINNLVKVKNKRKDTCQRKYNVDNPMQLNKFKEKNIKTNLNIYGVKCVFQSEKIKKKIIETNLREYGVEHLSKLPAYQKEKGEKIKKTFKNNFILNISELLNISSNNVNVDIDNETIIISNYCKKHEKFEILKNNFYARMKTGANICTKCFPIGNCSSICEIDLLNFIKDELMFEANKHFINNKEIDIYIPLHKLGIEYDGLFWHSNKFIEKNYHLNKTNECEKQGIQLLHIFEDEWHYKKEIIKSIIRSKLNIIQNKIYGRKCIIKEIDAKISKEFLENNHIQGFVGSNVKIGLFYNNDLVSVMTFGKKRITMGSKQSIEGEYEMLRFCNKLNTSVIGGASKLLSYFVKTYSPKSILTFADRRYSQGNLYKQLGFKFIGNTEPNYFYFKSTEMIRYYRFKFRKDVLIKEGFDSNKTESQIMAERGYLKIYDCGHRKFELKLQ